MNCEINKWRSKKILEEERKHTKDDRWIEHSISVRNSAGRIAKALEEKGHKVDVDKTIALGYVYDMGKYNGESQGHVIRGYNLYDLFPEIKENL